MKKHVRTFAAVTALLLLAACGHNSQHDGLLGRWTNRHIIVKQPAIVAIEFLGKNTMTLEVIDTFAAAGWHARTSTTGQYEIIGSDKLKLSDQIGAVVLDYRVDGDQLILGGHGLAGLLGKDVPPQYLRKGE